MNKKKWLIVGLNLILLVTLLVLKFLIKDFPDWITYVLIIVIFILMLFYRFETTKERQNNIEKEKIEEKNRKQFLISFLEAKAATSPTASVMYGILTKQTLELQALISEKNLEIDFDWNEEDAYYDVMITSKYKRNKELYYLSLSFEGEEEELLLNSGEEVSTNQMREEEIIDLIIEDMKKF